MKKLPTKQPSGWWLLPAALLALLLAGLFFCSLPHQTGTSQEWIDNLRILKTYLFRPPTVQEMREVYGKQAVGHSRKAGEAEDEED